MGNPKVSVILLCYNGKKFLDKCVSSLINQDYLNYELLFVDNVSTDGSTDFVRENFPEVKIVGLMPPNKGFADGNNRAIKFASGEVLLFISHDTYVEKNFISEMVRHHKNKKTICTPRIMSMQNPEYIDDIGGKLNILGYPTAIFHGERYDKKKHGRSQSVFSPCGAAFLMDKKLFEELCGFDESYYMYMEDQDLGWRARLEGVEVVSVPSAVVYHFLSATLGKSPVKYYYLERNRYTTLLKNYSSTTILLLSPLFIFFELFTLLTYAITLNFSGIKTKIKAISWNIRNLEGILKKRKQIQEKRKIRDDKILLLMSDYFLGSETSGVYHLLLLHIVNPLLRGYKKLLKVVVR